MVVEDLQNIYSEAKVKFASRKALLLIAGLVGFVALLIVFLILGLIVMSTRDCSAGAAMTAALSGGVTEDVCIAPLCLQAASFVAKNRNVTINPCDDFYKYSCQGWQDNTAMPPEFGHTSILDHLAEDNEQKWRAILESPIASSGASGSERKLKDFFTHCLHDYGRNDDGQDLVDAIKTNLGGWFVLDPQNWNANWNLDNAVANTHVEFLVGVMFDFEIWPDPANHRRHIITILPEPQGMALRDYTEPSRERIRNSYKTYMRKVARLLVRDSNVTMTPTQANERIETFVNDVFDHEQRLAQFKREANTYIAQRATLGEMSRNFTRIHWVEILNTIFSHASITSSTEIQVNQAAYFRILDNALGEEGNNMNRILNNYMVWRIVKDYTTVLSWEYRNARFDYIKDRTGYTEFPNTWESCMYVTKSRLGLAMAALFVKQHVGMDAPQDVEKLIGDLRSAALKSLEDITWMDEQTKKIAKYKLSNMDIMVGFPSVIGDNQKFEDLYDQLKVNISESFIRNIMYTNEFIRYLVSHELTEDYKDNMWRYAVLHSGLGVRPMYYWYYNSMLVPPGSLTFPLYNSMLSKAIVYGGIGHFIGERLIHSIDSIGRHVINGTFNTWWSDATEAGYSNATQCLNDNYKDVKAGPYIVDGEEKIVTIDGSSHVLRIVAKTYGLHIAYKGYMNKAFNLKQQLLPGVNLTQEQLFFVSSAQLQCSKRRDVENYFLSSAGLLPDEILVNGMMSQTPEFHKAFNCPATSKLQPASFCKLF